MTKAYWYDEQLAQTVLTFLAGTPRTPGAVGELLGVPWVEASGLLHRMERDGRLARVTAAGDSAETWVAAEIPLA